LLIHESLLCCDALCWHLAYLLIAFCSARVDFVFCLWFWPSLQHAKVPVVRVLIELSRNEIIN
jgi:hypothetical protein